MKQLTIIKTAVALISGASALLAYHQVGFAITVFSIVYWGIAALTLFLCVGGGISYLVDKESFIKQSDVSSDTSVIDRIIGLSGQICRLLFMVFANSPILFTVTLIAYVWYMIFCRHVHNEKQKTYGEELKSLLDRGEATLANINEVRAKYDFSSK